MRKVTDKMEKAKLGSPLFSGLMYSAGGLGVGATVLSLFLLYGSLEEASLGLYSLVVHAVVTILGGFTTAKKCGEKGWYHGGMLGLVYAVLVFIIGLIAGSAAFDLNAVQLLGVSVLGGAAGGVIGVNAKKEA
jgi:putative membrane protein (TIGR04086 family)